MHPACLDQCRDRLHIETQGQHEEGPASRDGHFGLTAQALPASVSKPEATQLQTALVNGLFKQAPDGECGQETEVAAKVLAELPFLVAGENVMSVMEEEVRASQDLDSFLSR